MAKKTKEVNRNWTVKMKCVVIKEVCIDNCTEDQARDNPWDQDVTDETEIEQTDWEVLHVEPNE